MLTLVLDDTPSGAEMLIGHIGVELPVGVEKPLEGAEILICCIKGAVQMTLGTADSSCCRASTTGALAGRGLGDAAPDTGGLTMQGLGDVAPGTAPTCCHGPSTTGALTVCGLIGEVLRLDSGMKLLARRSGEFGAAGDILRSSTRGLSILRSSTGGDRMEAAQQEAETVSGRGEGAGGDGDGSMLNDRGGTTDATHVGTAFGLQ